MTRDRRGVAARLAAAEKLRQERREVARGSLLAFGQTYLPHYFTCSPSRFHDEVAGMLERAAAARGERIAVAAPRGHAKSTLVSLAYILWCVCYGIEHYAVIISDTSSQAEGLLASVKKELEQNLRLREDFPDVCEPAGSRPGPARWRRDEIVTGNDVKITALGAGKKIRGRRHHQHRPGLIILDDVENEEAVRSAEQRDKLRDWLRKAVLKAGDSRTNVVVVGTIMHYDSLLAELIHDTKSPGWHGHKYQAVISWPTHPELWEAWEGFYAGLEENERGETGLAAARRLCEEAPGDMLEGVEVLWPEVEDFHRLMVMRVREGRASFDSEKQNEPVNPDDCIFQESEIHYWDDAYADERELIASLGQHYTVIGACDPSMGKAGRGRDDSAIITIVLDDRTGTLYVVDADISRRLPDRIIEDVLEYHRLRDYGLFGMEANQFQGFLSDELRRRGNALRLYPPVVDVTHTRDKLGRIQSLQPLIKSGTIRFCSRHRTLLDQLRQFPKAAHDDGPDALQMAVGLACEGRDAITAGALVAGYSPIMGDGAYAPVLDYMENGAQRQGADSGCLFTVQC
ncbi:phage terminase large subunit [Planctomycetota bacterium]